MDSSRTRHKLRASPSKQSRTRHTSFTLLVLSEPISRDPISRRRTELVPRHASWGPRIEDFLGFARQKFLPLYAPWVSLIYVLVFLSLLFPFLLPSSSLSKSRCNARRTYSIDNPPSALTGDVLSYRKTARCKEKQAPLDPHPMAFV